MVGEQHEIEFGQPRGDVGRRAGGDEPTPLRIERSEIRAGKQEPLRPIDDHMAQIWQALAPFQYTKQADVAFAFALVLFFGTMAGIPIIGYLIGADLIAKQLARPWNMIAFLALVVAGLGLYIVAMQSKTQVPLRSASDVWRTYSSGFVPILAVAGILFIRRYGRYFEPHGK